MFITKLKYLRLERGWTLAQLASKAEVSLSTASRWERASVKPHLRGEWVLNKIFDFPITELFEMKEIKF